MNGIFRTSHALRQLIGSRWVHLCVGNNMMFYENTLISREICHVSVLNEKKKIGNGATFAALGFGPKKKKEE